MQWGQIGEVALTLPRERTRPTADLRGDAAGGALGTGGRDVVALARITDQLIQASESVPSLKLYRRLAEQAVARAQGDHMQSRVLVESILNSLEPRSFIGWATTCGLIARSANDLGDHQRAKTICEEALAHIDDNDREFVTLFLDLDLELASAQASLGEVEPALARIDGLLARFRECDHPFLMGSLHEMRARIAWKAGLFPDYLHHLKLCERWFRPTGTPALIAKCERLAELQNGPTRKPCAAEGATTSLSSDAATQLLRKGPARA